MRPYIKNLTDHLISRNRFFDEWKLIKDREKFLQTVKRTLLVRDVQDMRSETLGKIMCSFEPEDVPAARHELLKGIAYGGDCEEVLRELVALCIAYAIRERIDHQRGSPVPPYRF